MTAPSENPYDPTRNPDLLAWLTERQAGFERWAEEAGGSSRFDFSPASLDGLEELIREGFETPEDVTEQRRTPFLQGAVWYLGELFCRHRGMVWKYEPDFDTGRLAPFFAAEEPVGVLDTPCVGLPGARPGENWFPLNMIRRLLIDEDEVGNPVDERLLGMLEGWYDDEDDEE
ncbi:hypothetical protein ACIHEJ_39225 [Streptomyces sp. NPDC052301]|uniref:hypothetical protein n=1 Tax=Streptomyces sp. NPDC052301 TaxID=3365687 RepID=UPI0037D4AFCD